MSTSTYNYVRYIVVYALVKYIIAYVPKLGINIGFFMHLLRYILIYTYMKVGYAYLITHS
jgi:hypothetical protein